MKRYSFFKTTDILKSSLLALIVFSITACGDSKQDDLPIAEISQPKGSEKPNWKETITLTQFETRYLEAAKTLEQAKKDSVSEYKNFVDRYVNFRLKVKDAEDSGLGQSPEVTNELKQYRDQMAGSYLTEKEVMDKAIKDLYERRKEEVDASHILIRVDKNAAPADTEKAYSTISSILKNIKAGTLAFDSAAFYSSEDPSAKQNYGRLNYFTAGMMVASFEDAAFEAKKGDIVGPVRTQFGYHLLKIHDRRARNSIQASHIMAICRKESSPEDTARAYEKIVAAQERLKKGEAFEVVAKEVSDDKQSGQNGGDLGSFSKGQIPSKEFDEAAFELKKVGDVSPIVRSAFGYHLIKLTFKGNKSLAEERETIKTILKRNSDKLASENDKLVARLKVEYKFVENPLSIKALVAKTDSNTTASTLESLALTDAEKKLVVFSFATQTYTVDSLLNFIKRAPATQKLNTEFAFKLEVDKYAKKEVVDYATSQLDSRYPEFAKLMKDYRDGILLFAISEKNVWAKAIPNDSVAELFYKANKSKFNYSDRVAVSAIVASSADVADKLYKELSQKKRVLDVVTLTDVKKKQKTLTALLKKLNKKSKTYKAQKDSIETALKNNKVDDNLRTFDELAKRYSKRFDETDGAKQGIFQKGESKIADFVFNENSGFVSSTTLLENEYLLIRVDKKEAARPKTFEEAKPEVVSLYQEKMTKELEDNWVKTLRDKSDVRVHEENFKKAFQFVEEKKPEQSTAASK